MKCYECGRGTKIKYSVHNNTSIQRTRECSQGHLTQTIEIRKEAFAGMRRTQKILENPESNRADIQMTIANLIGDL